MASLGEEAQRYASAGYPVFPCRLDKKPLTEHGFQDATKVAAVIANWWTQWPDASIGIPTGAVSGIWVLDVDPRHNGGEGLQALEAHGQLPETVQAETGGGGTHLWFKMPGVEVRNSAGVLGPGLDIRGEGGYVIVPPSKHPQGQYRWVISPFESTPAEGPRWLTNLLHTPRAPAPVVLSTVGVQEGARNATLLSLGGTMRKRGFSPESIREALRKENASRCHPPLDEKEVDAIVQSLLRYAPGLPTPVPDRHGEESTAPVVTWVPYSAIVATRVSWLWYPYIPLGRLTSIEGNPGDGKSWFALAVAAQLSHGYWYLQVAGEESVRTPAVTLYLSCEDNPNDTLRPRLDILGANLPNVLHLTAHNTQGEFVLLKLDDIPSLRHAILSTGAKLLLIDPVQAYLPKGTDMNKAEHMRPVLAALNALAEETNCAIVLIRHFGKAVRDVTLHRAIGSVDFAAAVRSVLVVGRDQRDETPTGESRHVVLQVKNNIAQKGLPLGFTLKQDEFTWTASTMTEEEFSRSPLDEQDEAGPRAEAKEFLHELLQDGPCVVKDIRKQNTERGGNWRTVQRARNDLKIKSYKDSTGTFWWELVESCSPSS